MAISNETPINEDVVRFTLQHLAEHGIPPAGEAPIFDIGTADFIEFFKDEVVDHIVASGGATCRFFEGPAGSGKTHLLQLLEAQARKQSMAFIRIDLSQALNISDWQLITKYILENITFAFPDGDVCGLPSILEHLGRIPEIRVQDLKNAMLPHPGFKSAMISALHPAAIGDEARLRLAEYLSGQKVGAGIFRKLNVYGVKNPLSARNAEQVLNTVIGGLYYLGISGTILLFDENEKIFEVRNTYSQRTRTAANLMRRLIDCCFTGGLVGTCIIFAVLPNFMEACSMVYPALGQRVRFIRNGKSKPSWRWPILCIDDLSTVKTPEQFLDGVIKALLDIVQRCHGDVRGLSTIMQNVGARVLQSNAGAGYRRPLIKALAATAVERLD